ncbi:MAG: anti-sigma factor [Terrimesophilobacter sp.]
MNLTPREQADIEAALGLAVEPVEPSAQLKSSLMAKIAQTPQLRALAEANDDREVPAFVASSLGSGRAERRAHARWFSGPVAVLTSAAAAVLLFVGGTVVGGAVVGGQVLSPTSLDAEAQSLATLTAAVDLQLASTAIEGGGEATLVWSLEQRKSAILVNDLPPLPEGKTYQLWYIGERGAIPAGTFETTPSATSWRVLDGQMSEGDALGVTVEPSCGSEQPTTTPIVTLQS